MTITSLDCKVRDAFKVLCLDVGSPLALEALAALENEDWVGLTTIKVVISGYDCPRLLSGDLQIAAFFKKYPGFDLGIDLEEKARASFWQCERLCYEANEYLGPLLVDPLVYGEGVRDLISRARKEVLRILGPAPQLEDLNPRFGPGSTFSDIGPLITVPDKMSNAYTMTLLARPLMRAWDTTAWSRYAASGSMSGCRNNLEQLPEDSIYAPRTEDIVRGNRFTTVPKDAWKLRGICIEPSINLFYQLGAGEVMTKRLKRTCGWDKKTIQDIHRRLAREGSLSGDLATIDLSNASDTICRALVQLLLPSDWHDLLTMLRSSHTCVDGRWVRLEKFSSMGNGFTFELETILFRALTVAAQREAFCFHGEWYGGQVSTFGDDIICPTSSARDVIAALQFAGFKINEDKTFIDGDFRESCGGDFFRGLDVRPHFLKEITNEPHQYIALANGIRRFGIRHILCGGPSVHYRSWLSTISALPNRIRRLRGPEGLGDIVIHDEEDRWQYTVRSSIRYIRVWRPVAYKRTPWSHFRPGVVFASALYGVSDGSAKSIGSQEHSRTTADGVLSSFRGEYISGYRFGHVAYS